MIYPTQRAVWLVAASALPALIVGVVAPVGWVIAPIWIAAILVLIVADALLTPRLRGAAISIGAPGSMGVGETVNLAPGLERNGQPVEAEIAAEVDGPMIAADNDGLVQTAERRGLATVRRIWARRSGPLGLAWRQLVRAVDIPIRILPDLRPTREQGMRQYLRSTQFGARMRLESGDGQEFQALTDFQPGMERRTIDWKSSARHLSLLAREYRTERDNALVLAVDSGRAMCDPVDDVPRVDRAVSAALLAAFVALKSGDRVRLFSFAAKPQVDSGTQHGSRSFASLHRAAADIDYSREESNYTLSMLTLDQKLQRRSLIVLFTEFTDPTAAELMIAAARRMLKRHRVLFVLFRDVELEAVQTARPETADDVVRANIATTLIRERRIVIERLKRLGIDVLEAAPDAMPLALAERYWKERERS
ncbi:DUF58 domain-containing protein [Stakelama sediminis]|uniref:Uncharacterized protein (DUF58 family) n=1 Tax=Stakelama sediminis TaxID=463200 RepID=A0A840Z179_9SPHN|nr:DUF58 domain-containing protein [Stakelama sediminis]MBB5719476.1 uncharacterized protein (DUF58 family) [Stakelama sediminis]